MKNLLYLLLFSISLIEVSAQERLIDREGKVRFFSEAPLEDIEAITNDALGVLDMSSNKVAASIAMKSFHFDKSLMEEHFNENYVESDKYPKATLSGTFQSPVDYTENGKVEVVLKGEMTIHGVTNTVEPVVTLDISDEVIQVETIFMISVADYDVKIPSIVFNNIAEEVEVTATFSFKK